MSIQVTVIGDRSRKYYGCMICNNVTDSTEQLFLFGGFHTSTSIPIHMPLSFWYVVLS